MWARGILGRKHGKKRGRSIGYGVMLLAKKRGKPSAGQVFDSNDTHESIQTKVTGNRHLIDGSFVGKHALLLLHLHALIFIAVTLADFQEKLINKRQIEIKRK